MVFSTDAEPLDSKNLIEYERPWLKLENVALWWLTDESTFPFWSYKSIVTLWPWPWTEMVAWIEVDEMVAPSFIWPLSQESDAFTVDKLIDKSFSIWLDVRSGALS